MKTPIVDVAMVTYNHERFIGQAIDSVLMQETNFEYRLIIGDDCSEDRTQEIIRSYAQKYADRIYSLLSTQHLGLYHPERVGLQVLAKCTARYTALLDGDDYWTVPHKLQRQVDFLESHPECSICFHAVRWFYDEGIATSETGPQNNTVWPEHATKFSSIEDLLKSLFIQTGSVLLRNGLFGEYPEWFHSLRIGDWPLLILHAEHGFIGFLDEVMSAYRKHSGGLGYAADDATALWDVIKMYEVINAHLNGRYQKVIRPILADHYLQLAMIYERNDSNSAKECISKSLTATILNGQKPSITALKMLARLLFPSLYGLSKKLIRA